ncbi:MAG: ABC transporter substrate-binding protein [Acetobacteraceae bacterium]|nr:ABC transporter substrate-binding protein [Acetobacteraceae bacterium]
MLAICLLGILPALGQAQTLRIALREDPDQLDPTLARSYVGRIVFAGLCDKLFDINEKLEIVPRLATSHEWADPVTLILRLRQGVTFHNGEPLDAAAVKFTLERHLTMSGSFRRSEIASIDHVEIVDPATVKVVLKSPSAPLLSQLTDRSGMILPPKATEAAGKDFSRAPICSGPFKFNERVAQDRIVLDRYPGYWDAASIHFDKVVYQPMPDSAVLLANLRSGTVDLAERVLPTDIAQVKADAKLRIVTSPGLGYEGITFNSGNGERAKAPIGQNKLLRQAFDAALDRQALIDVVFNGMYTPTAQAVSAASPFYIAAIPPPPRDLAKAKALIKESGIPTPIVVQMNVPNTPDRAQLAEVIQSMVKEAGFDVKINLIEFAASLQAATRGEFESYLIGWSGRADPDGNLFSFLHSSSGQNDGKYANPVVDQALSAGRQSVDLAVRRGHYETALRQIRQDLPVIYLFAPVNVVGLSAKLTGFRPVPDGMIRLQGMAAAK